MAITQRTGTGDMRCLALLGGSKARRPFYNFSRTSSELLSTLTVLSGVSVTSPQSKQIHAQRDVCSVGPAMAGK